MGREKFADLLKEFQSQRWGVDRSALWIYGTKGYGKSHLLAALVCLLIAQNERIIYIPDCRECLRNPVGYVRAAVLLAWADDASVQEMIIALDTMDTIYHFLYDSQEDFVFVIDQLNALEQGPKNSNADCWRADVSKWLTRCRTGRNTILSTSTTYHAYIRQSIKENTEDTLYVYGGLTPVSLNKKKTLHWKFF
jgi:hypothetical protein